MALGFQPAASAIVPTPGPRPQRRRVETRRCRLRACATAPACEVILARFLSGNALEFTNAESLNTQGGLGGSAWHQLESGARLSWIVTQVSPTAVLLAAILSAPPAAVAIWSIGRTVSQMSDPCFRWDGGGGPEWSATLRPNDPCRSITVHGESKRRAAAICALIPGGVLLSAVLGMTGLAVSRRRLILTAAFLMLAETLVVFSIAPLTLIAGLGLLFLGRRVPHAQVQI